jgi:hypothetical protein
MTNCAADELGGDFGNDIRWIVAPRAVDPIDWSTANRVRSMFLEYNQVAPLPERISRRAPLWSVP